MHFNNKLISLIELMAGVQPGSIHGPLSCNLFINDVSFFHFCTLSNYTDNNKLFTTATVMKLINQILSSDFRPANNWFYENLMILHPGKCHFMSIGKDMHDEDRFDYDNLTFRNSNER